ncbi:MAG: BT4734/BF3469 family protein [Paludibacter sp.]
MEAINKQQILSKTNYGLLIYSHILQKYYPNQTVLSLSGRTCAPTQNPFNENKLTLNVFIEKDSVLGNALDNEFARHTDSENAIPAGDAFDFAELHYKQRGNELLQTINIELHLHIGEKRNFYGNNRNFVTVPEKPQPQSPTNRPNSDFLSPNGESTRRGIEVGGVGAALFSFYKSPIKNTVPHKSATLLQIYNAITGDFYKERTDKLRSIADPKQARLFKAINFDYCTFSGTFSSRNDKNLMQHSGLMAVDFDHLPNLEDVRQALLADEYFDTQLLFVSPSGDGLKWIIPIDTSQIQHAEYFAAVANYILQTYCIEVDKSGSDISRACFLPYDPDAFIHPNIH